MEFLTHPHFIFAFSLTLLAGLATSVGGVIALFVRTTSTVGLSLGLGFSAGVMIYVSFVEIFPEAIEAFTEHYSADYGYALATAALFAGIALSAAIDSFIPKDVNPHELKKESEFIGGEEEVRAQKARALKRTGVFTALAVAIHNFPEGFATFTVAMVDPSIAIPIAIAIAIHNIPEGVAVALPIYHSTGSRKKAFWYATGSGLAEPVGAIIGFALLAPFLSEATLGIVFAMVAGIMIYISFDELLPTARLYGTAHSAIIGLMGGMFVMALSLVMFETW
ncbi:zinc/iron permease [Desulfurispirillum indicum S5]|uniref:Zinc transporter ZupT n=1 Tax=Desulfurispirillum indicum (strain ATCC BAA-1389 / DSM 22839 / S5) TaxID=653733 RepID=E6W1D1_DESIS|nr:zinc transporter ZupT [Desulfurispirillum indicum]ADU65387.1 zinc/iron permease [Desulfurispirillum indicum S5]